MKQFLPASPNSSQVIVTLLPSQDEDRPCNQLGSILASVVAPPRRAFDVTEFDDTNSFPCFTPPQFSSAFLASRHTVLLAQDILEKMLVEMAADRFLEAEALTDAELKNNFKVNRGQQFEPLQNFVGKVNADEKYNALISSAVLWPTPEQFSTNNRVRRPSWAENDWELAQRVIGTPALIAQMEWVNNMNSADIAEALAMKPATVQKVIARMGNDVKRLGLRDGFQVGGSITRFDFALLELKEMGLSDANTAAILVKRWFGEHAVNSYKIAVMYWQQNMTAVDIAEELEMTKGAVQQRLLRLQQGEGE